MPNRNRPWIGPGRGANLRVAWRDRIETVATSPEWIAHDRLPSPLVVCVFIDAAVLVILDLKAKKSRMF